jgi:hypothetical protein
VSSSWILSNKKKALRRFEVTVAPADVDAAKWMMKFCSY